ncbi:uncharacterized protein VTP21DRAFT_10593 [Calcarisporiella thermophila]|uniref:uncharacterized protein n=1 Tax=Calcarisporiella thermophila TaxID=911321 RepID=UPI003743D526
MAPKPSQETNQDREQDYNHTLHRLSALQCGWDSLLTIESVPLVSRLLDELELAAELRDTLREEKKASDRARWHAESQLEPLRKEILYLTQENNQLHVDIIHAADEKDRVEIEERKKRRLLEEQIEALKMIGFAQGQGDVKADSLPQKSEELKKVEELEEEIEQLSKKVEHRENEITRLNAALEERCVENMEYLNSKSSAVTRSTRVEQLETLVEYLQDRVMDLEENVGRLKREKEMLASTYGTDRARLVEQVNAESRKKLGKNLCEVEKLTRRFQSALLDRAKDGETDDTEGNSNQRTMTTEELEEHVAMIQKSLERTNEQIREDFEQLKAENSRLRLALVEARSELDRPQSISPQNTTSPRPGQSPTSSHDDSRPSHDSQLQVLESQQRLITDQLRMLGEKLSHIAGTPKDSVRDTLRRETTEKVEGLGSSQQYRELISLLRQFEFHIDNIEEEMRSIEVERENLKLLYSQMHEELMGLYKDRTRYGNGNKTEDKKEEEETRQAISRLERRCEELNEELRYREERIRGLERKQYGSESNTDKREEQELAGLLAQVTADRDSLKASLRESDAQVNHLRAQVTSYIRECERLDTELTRVMAERDRLASELRISMDRHKECELREQDKVEEIRRLKETARKMERESGEQLRERRIAQLQRALDDCALEIGRVKEEKQFFEQQCRDLKKSLASAEKELQQTEEEHIRLQSELKNARDMLFTLDGTRNELQIQLRDVSVENERLTATLRELERDKQDALHQMQVERSRSDRLERVVADLRAHAFQNMVTRERVLTSRAALEEKMQGLTRDGEMAIRALKEELREVQEEARRLRTRVESLQRDMMVKDTELAELQVERRKLVERMKRYEDQFERGSRVESFVSQFKEEDGRRKFAGLGEGLTLDGRILAELEETRRKLQRYESRLERMEPALFKSRLRQQPETDIASPPESEKRQWERREKEEKRFMEGMVQVDWDLKDMAVREKGTRSV